MRAKEFITEAVRQRLDPKCWTGKHKAGTKIKGGVRVNNCVPNEGVAEGLEQQYLWHGSRQKIPMLEPRQSVDTGGAVGSNQNAIYATSDPKVAIAMGLTTPGSDTGMFPNDPQMVLFSGKIRKGENVYLHKVPMNGPDGKPQFVQGGNSREFHSVSGVEVIKPTEIKAVPVDKYLNLIRQATPQDLELRKKYMRQGVAEGLENNGISFQVQKGKNKFATTLSIGNNPVGVYQYDANTGRSLAEVYPEFRSKGFGKLLVLHAIYTAAKLGLDFQEDESRTAEYDNVLDSLNSNGYIVDDDGYWYVTGEGEQYLQQSIQQGVAEGSDRIAKVEGMLVSAWDYLQSQKAQGINPQVDETAAWRRKEGKSKSGGLNAKGVASYRRENPGSKLQTAVTTKPSKLKPGSKAAKRRKSFCARMGGMKGPMKKPNGKSTRKALALRKWNCESVEQMVDMILENMDHAKDNQAVPELKAALLAKKSTLQQASEDDVYDIIDTIMTRIAKSHGMSGQKLHSMWVKEYDQIPDTWIMK